MAAMNREQIRDLYRRRAHNYDVTANLYYLLGFREQAYRRRAVDALGAVTGETVVEIGCGTGLNLPMLRDAVGPDGSVVGVDLTDAMLAEANARIAGHGWDNVHVVQSDAAEFEFPPNVAGIISTFALTLMPAFDEIIARGARALRPGGRWVVLDFKEPRERFRWLLPLAARITKPFGVTLDLAERHPWESLERHLGNVDVTELYGGFAYIATSRGEAAV